jgi:DNA-binding CsgD family transcriptional regulator
MTSSETAAKATSLSELQRTYLRFVAQGMTSKQIAQSIGGSHHTVNAEIGVAMRVFGARSRHEAAAILARVDKTGSYDSSYEPPAIVELPSRPEEPAGVEGEEQADHGQGWGAPVATRRRPINTLTAGQRVGWILVIASVVALLLGGLVSGVATLLVSLNRLI